MEGKKELFYEVKGQVKVGRWREREERREGSEGGGGEEEEQLSKIRQTSTSPFFIMLNYIG